MPEMRAKGPMDIIMPHAIFKMLLRKLGYKYSEISPGRAAIEEVSMK